MIGSDCSSTGSARLALRALVDTAVLEQPERGAEQQDGRPASAGGSGDLSDQDRRTAVESVTGTR